jgi:hypothetical protein
MRQRLVEMNTLSLFLLQSLGDFRTEANPVHGVIFVIGVVVIVILVVFFNKSTKVRNSTVFKSGAVKKTGNYGIKNLRTAAHKYGLEHEERKFLSNKFREEEINSSVVFISRKTIDEGFAKIVRALSREEGTDDDIEKLFAIRNKIEYYITAGETAEKASKKNLIVRRYKRAEANIPAVFYLVIEREIRRGLKNIKKLSLDSTKCIGTILDISSGGCAMNTRNPFKAGSRIKIEFKIGKNNLSALAKILRINQNRYGSVLHTRFLKVSVKSLNAINSFVYNYNNF